MKGQGISRRQFTKQAGCLVVGFGLTGSSITCRVVDPGETALGPKGTLPGELDSWISIDKEGLVTAYCGRIDMGTGVRTAWSQMLADELDVPLAHIKMVLGDTQLTPDQGKSTASNNASVGAQPLRIAAAEARGILLELAAQELGAARAELTIRDGIVSVQGALDRRVSYGDLIGGKAFGRTLEVVETTPWGPALRGTATPKDPAQYRLVGTSVPRLDIPAKAVGSFEYVHDVRLPGMLHGRVVRPPSWRAELVGLEEDSVGQFSGGVQVVRKGNFVGVVAQREEEAIGAARELKVSWSDPEDLPAFEAYDWLRQSPVLKSQVPRDEGDVEAALQSASRTLRATYQYPWQMHGMLGPSCAVADVRDDQITIWSGSQWLQGNRRDLAEMLEVPVERVRFIWAQAAGCYGRLGCDDAAADAALLSQAVGRPVRVQWMRHDEHGFEPMSPALSMDLRAGLDAEGNVVAWDFEQWTSSHASGERGSFLAWQLQGTAPGNDRLTGGNGLHSYTFPNNRSQAHFVEPPFRSIYLRAPGRIQNNLAIESFVDEVAAAKAVDPLEFRLRHLEDPDAIAVLRAAAEGAGWESRRSPQAGSRGARLVQGRGLAFGEHSRGQKIALVTEVEVDRQTGRVKILKAVAACQSGLIVNPEGLKHQVEGAIIQGLSRSLLEEVEFEGSGVSSLDWISYPILKFSDIPDMTVILLNQKDRPPAGVGELATVPVAGAVGNAIFDAIGVRLRTVPFNAERVKAALA